MSLHIEKTMRNSAANLIAIVGAALLALPAAPVPAFAAGSVTLAQVEARGVLRCGVSDGIAGFSQQDASGHWSGIDVDFCRAVANQDATGNDFDPATQQRVFARSYSQCVAIYSR